MFDDVKNNIQEINQNNYKDDSSKPVEDIFSETEKVNPKTNLNENLDTKTMPSAYQPANINTYESGKIKKNILKILLFLIFVAIIGIGGYLAYGMYLDSQANKKTNEQQDFKTSSTNENSPSNDVTIISGKITDSDNDGLSDQEESIYGTDISLPDTDSDGLFDREEIKIYKTDPLNSDTDGDGYLDGDEVKSGYSPLGPGRLWPENPNGE